MPPEGLPDCIELRPLGIVDSELGFLGIPAGKVPVVPCDVDLASFLTG